MNEPRLPGVGIAEGISEITGVAVSPLLGVSVIGAWTWWRTEAAMRDKLPWYCQPVAWGIGLGASWQPGLALLAFVGGLSAATGMIIVEAIAVSTMVCNDLVMPLLLRVRWLGLADKADLSGLLLEIRRTGAKDTVLMPYQEEFIAGVDVERGVLVVDPPEGLFE